MLGVFRLNRAVLFLNGQMEIFSRPRKMQIPLVTLTVFSFLLVLIWHLKKFGSNLVNEMQMRQDVNRTDMDLLQIIRLDLQSPSYRSPCPCSRNITSRYHGKVDYKWCNEEATQRGLNQKIVSFSLFGNADKNGMRYFSFMRENAVKIKQLLPGWIMRLHHNTEVDTEERKMLCDVYCDYPWIDLCDVSSLWRRLSKRKKKNPDLRPVTGEQISKVNRRIWRFLPLLDPFADIVLTRDLDATVSDREVAAVQQWLQFNYTFHLMRDHQAHKTHILAGMFGVKVHQRRDLIEGLTRVLINFGQNQKYDTDQTLLSKIFWPSVRHDVMAHDSYNCMENWNALPTYPFPTKRVNKFFVSDNFEGRWIAPDKCPLACRPIDHQDWEYC